MSRFMCPKALRAVLLSCLVTGVPALCQSHAAAETPIALLILNGKETECRVLRSWPATNGGTLHQVQNLATREMMTLVPDNVNGGVRVIHWGIGAKTAPLGTPTPPSGKLPPPVEAPPTQEETPPIREEAPPTQEETPPIREEAPLIQKEIPPIRDETPPIREQAPTVPKETPPIRDEAPAETKRIPAATVPPSPSNKRVASETKTSAHPSPTIVNEPAAPEPLPAKSEFTPYHPPTPVTTPSQVISEVTMIPARPTQEPHILVLSSFRTDAKPAAPAPPAATFIPIAVTVPPPQPSGVFIPLLTTTPPRP